MSRVAEWLRPILAETITPAPSAQIEDDIDLVELGMDELDVLEVLVRAEDKFDVELDDEKAHRLRTPAEWIAFIDRAIGARSNGRQPAPSR